MDVIWFTKAEKTSAIVDAVRQAIRSGKEVLVLAHFKATLDEAGRALEARGTEHRIADRHLDPGRVHSTWFAEAPAKVILSLTDYIRRYDTPHGHHWQTRALDIIVAEHYPIGDRDGDIMRFAEACGIAGNVRFHSSLEDPLLREFGSERHAEVLKALSKGSTAPMSGKQISKAIRSAQNKVKKQAFRDEPVASPEECFDYNLRRGLGQRLRRNST